MSKLNDTEYVFQGNYWIMKIRGRFFIGRSLTDCRKIIKWATERLSLNCMTLRKLRGDMLDYRVTVSGTYMHIEKNALKLKKLEDYISQILEENNV